MRCRLSGYQYSEIIRSLMSVYFCGGICIEDMTFYIRANNLTPHIFISRISIYKG